MSTTADLIEVLKGSLKKQGYSMTAVAGGLAGLNCQAVFATATDSPPRFLCVVAKVPPQAQGPADVGAFVAGLRCGLTKQYVHFPWFRRLGTFTVLLADHELFELCRGQEDRFIDQDGLHVNVMLGAVLVDAEAFAASSQNTWGLLGDSDHFSNIRDTVENWCQRHRRHDRSIWSDRKTVGVA